MTTKSSSRIDEFAFPTGRVLAGRYSIEAFLGSGWEGEAYRVREQRTGVERAAKIFYPHRNRDDIALRRYARKVERLADCPIVTRYHHSESLRHRGRDISFLVSELVEGELLEEFVKRQRGRRLHPFEALHLVHTIASGMVEIHAQGEFHGDLHDRNALVRRRGIGFKVKLVDLFTAPQSVRDGQRQDVLDLVRLLYDVTGGARHYARQPPEVKRICAGLRKGLILERFPTMAKLARYLESFGWADSPV